MSTHGFVGFAKTLAIGLAAISLAACVTTPKVASPGASWPERRAQLQSDASYSLGGRAAVSAQGQGFNASLRWIQDGPRSTVSLDGPLGVGGAVIETDGRDISLVTPRERVEGDAARIAMEERLGFTLPLAELRYWVRGVPAPDMEAAESLDPDSQTLTALDQNGWHIDYLEYTATDSGRLPRRLTAIRDGTRVKLVIDRWDR